MLEHLQNVRATLTDISNFHLFIFILILFLVAQQKILRILKQRKAVINSRCFVLTGCDSGIGQEILRNMTQNEEVTEIIAIFFDKNEAKRMNIESYQKVFVVQCDLSDVTQIQSTVEVILQRNRENLHSLVNIAGIMKAGDALIMDNASFVEVMQVNFFGTVFLTQGLLPALIQNQGSVLFTSSILAKLSLPGLSSYTASKLALEGYADCLRRETRLLGLRVITVRPPQTKTKLLNNLWKSYQNAFKSAPIQNKQLLGEEYIDRVTNGSMALATEMSSMSVEYVSSEILRIILDGNSGPSHWIGWFSKWVALPLSLIPSWPLDLLLVHGNRILFGIQPKPLTGTVNCPKNRNQQDIYKID